MLCLSDKSKNRNKSDNISCDILNQTIKIIHGRINADHNTNGRVHFVLSVYYFSFTLGTLALTMTNNMALNILTIKFEEGKLTCPTMVTSWSRSNQHYFEPKNVISDD